LGLNVKMSFRMCKPSDEGQERGREIGTEKIEGEGDE
jgi:hypothetical protein